MDDDRRPDPLAALAGNLAPVKYAIRVAAFICVSGAGTAAFAAAAWFGGLLLGVGSPFVLGLEIPLGEEREWYLSALTWGPATMLGGSAVATVGLVAARLLVLASAARTERALDAMSAAYRRPGTESSPASGRRGRLRLLLIWAIALLVVIAGWLAGADLLQIDPVPDSPLALIANALGALLGALFIAVCLLFISIVVYLLHGLAEYLIGWLVGPFGIQQSHIAALELARAEALEAEATRRWPPRARTELRLVAAVRVLAAPPPRRRRRRERKLHVPWLPDPTGVESLAATLLAAAIVECGQTGVLEWRVRRRRVYLQSVLPAHLRPEGLARAVLGHHRAGLDPGRTVSGTLDQAIASWLPSGDEDPHWRLVEAALDDLRAASILTAGNAIDVERLRTAADSAPPLAAGTSFDQSVLSVLVSACDRALGRMRTVDGGGSLTVQVIGLALNHARRRGRELPPPLAEIWPRPPRG